MVLLIGCEQKANESEKKIENNSYSEKNKDENNCIKFEYEKGIWHDKDWDSDVGTYKGDAVPNENVAVAVASAIFDGVKNPKTQYDFVAQNVFFDEKDEVWIVSFWPDRYYIDENTIIVGECYNISFQKKDAKVLRIWVGE